MAGFQAFEFPFFIFYLFYIPFFKIFYFYLFVFITKGWPLVKFSSTTTAPSDASQNWPHDPPAHALVVY